MDALLCCCPLRPGAPEPPAGAADKGGAALVVPVLPIQMLRHLSEVRILNPKQPPSSDGSARSLFEASLERVASNEKRVAAALDEDDGGLPTRFLEAYLGAIRDGDTAFAQAPAVAAMFADGARLVTQDKQTFVGRAAVLRRLDKGVATLVKLAGPGAAPAEVAVAGPARTPTGTHALTCTLRRGGHAFAFTLDFAISRGQVVCLTNTRGVLLRDSS